MLVAGDADFLHVAAALHRRGGRVVMIGVSGSTSGRLEAVVDEIIFYDEDIDIDQAENAEGRERETPTGTLRRKNPCRRRWQRPDARFAPPRRRRLRTRRKRLLVRLLREQRESEGGRNYPPLLSWLGLQMRDRAPRFQSGKAWV